MSHFTAHHHLLHAFSSSAGTHAVEGALDTPRRNMDASAIKAMAVLNDLLVSCRESEYRFRNASENAEALELNRIFSCHSDDYADAASELEGQIRALGGEPAVGGSLSDVLYRSWSSVKAALTTQNDQAVLHACERSQDSAVGDYCKALQNPLPPSALAVVERQVQVAQRNHDEVRELCERYQAVY